jgi:hypothetical protein
LKPLFLIILLSSIAFAHTEDIYPDQYAIIKRMNYAEGLEKDLHKSYKQVSVSLFGLELEHILILSPFCSSIQNYLLTGAHQLGILSATCRWYDGQKHLKVPK